MPTNNIHIINDNDPIAIRFVDAYDTENEIDINQAPYQPYIISNIDQEEVSAEPLCENDRELFKELDNDVTELWGLFCLFGYCLSEIKKEQLYRETHPSFSAYCRDRLELVHIKEKEEPNLVVERRLQILINQVEGHLAEIRRVASMKNEPIKVKQENDLPSTKEGETIAKN